MRYGIVGLAGMSDTQKNKGGRPRAALPGARVTTWVPAREYERLRTISRGTGLSMSKVVRHLLAKQANQN